MLPFSSSMDHTHLEFSLVVLQGTPSKELRWLKKKKYMSENRDIKQRANIRCGFCLEVARSTRECSVLNT
jgi:hypothetical protein